MYPAPPVTNILRSATDPQCSGVVPLFQTAAGSSCNQPYSLGMEFDSCRSWPKSAPFADPDSGSSCVRNGVPLRAPELQGHADQAGRCGFIALHSEKTRV